MTELLYQKDMELFEFDAKVVFAEGNKIELDRTAFYPKSGGVAEDRGTIERNGEVFQVLSVRKEGPRIIHELDRPGLVVGEEIVGKVDSARRRILSRYHTTAHLLIGIMNKELSVLVTGNNLDVDGGRIDIDWETFDKGKLEEIFAKANSLIGQNLPVKVYEIARNELEKRPELVKLAMGLPPALQTVRIVEIVGVDAQPDGGCHVGSLIEIGSLEFSGYESKGKKNKRFRFVIRNRGGSGGTSN
ncbi:MAG: alanyl-tRNA editing protein [archaeon]